MVTDFENLRKGLNKVEEAYGIKFDAFIDPDDCCKIKLVEGTTQEIGVLDITDMEQVAENCALGIVLNRLVSRGMLRFDKNTIFLDSINRIIDDAISRGIIKDYYDLASKTNYNVSTINLVLSGKVSVTSTFISTILKVLEIYKWSDWCDVSYE